MYDATGENVCFERTADIANSILCESTGSRLHPASLAIRLHFESECQHIEASCDRLLF